MVCASIFYRSSKEGSSNLWNQKDSRPLDLCQEIRSKSSLKQQHWS